MIERPTVLVLGAGASKPYGFPTGEELLRQIVAIPKRPIPPNAGTALRQVLRECGFEDQLITDFVDELNRSGRKSVDAFLEHRPEFEKIGKAAMIAALIPKEDPATLFDRSNPEHWYQYLFQQMGSSRGEIATNKLSFITFNYDRSLECFLLNALKSSFNLALEKCLVHLARLPIIHLHGQLGALLGNEGDPDYRHFEQKVTPDIVERCIREIKIIHEVNVSDNPQFQQANELLVNAERICFLGFGYDKTNIQRLGTWNTLKSLINDARKQFCGTARGFTPTEIGRIIHAQFSDRFVARDCNNLELLRQTGVLL
jgi:hypothetical protein